ncbi:MAG TPA: CoA pyrophosphatase [Bacilli bacterium]|nr:CoA pyrophosphatase [Bacilli bacterium]
MEQTSLKRIAETFARREAGILGEQSLKKAAVFVPLLEQDGELHVLFQERAHHLRNQPGEICFPGGRVEAQDANPRATAVRETCEELGLPEQGVEVLGKLDILVSYFQIIYPYVGRIREPGQIAPDADEVAEVFTVPLSDLLQQEPEMHPVGFQVVPPDEFPFDWIQNGRAYHWRQGKIPQYFYFYEDRIIWGLTARILHHFLAIVRER